jgi:hypothetical protein
MDSTIGGATPSTAREAGEKTRWQTLIDLATSLVLPIALALVGVYFTNVEDGRQDSIQAQQKADDDQREDFNKVTELMDRLTSNLPEQRAMALMVLQHYATNCELAKAMVPAILFGIQDKDAQVKNDAVEAMKIAGNTCPDFKQAMTLAVSTSSEAAKSADAAAEVNPSSVGPFDFSNILPRVYIHIRDQSQHAAATQIASNLENQGFVVPRIVQASKGPDQTQLRYFKINERADADKAVAALDVANAVIKPMSQYEKSTGIRARHYELWLAPGPVVFNTSPANLPSSPNPESTAKAS